MPNGRGLLYDRRPVPPDGYDERQRYRIFLVRDGDPLREVASAGTPTALGLALVTMHEDCLAAGGHLWDDGRIGIQDDLTGEWIVHPWPRGLRS